MKKIVSIVILILFFNSVVVFGQEVFQKDSIVINTDSVYAQGDVDMKAEYTDGEKARIKFIERNVNGGVAAENKAPDGIYRVIVICIIDTNGKIIVAVPETRFGYGMEKEVLRIIKELPKPYKPAIKNGVAVKSKIKFEVVFGISRSGQF